LLYFFTSPALIDRLDAIDSSVSPFRTVYGRTARAIVAVRASPRARRRGVGDRALSEEIRFANFDRVARVATTDSRPATEDARRRWTR
jgi:hypothetical protein